MTSLSLDPELSIDYAKRRAGELTRNTEIATPFLARIAKHTDIDEECRRYIRKLQADPMIFRRGAQIQRVDESVRDIFVVQMGWLIGYTHTPSGQRYIHRVYQPGDMIGIEDINWTYRTSSVSAVTPCVLTAFMKGDLRTIFDESPRLSRTIFSVVCINYVQAYDRQRALGRLGAEARLADFLLQLHSRAASTDTAVSDVEFMMPLNQVEVGDAIGLTNVSVSRAYSSLAERGWLTRANGRVVFDDKDALIGFTDFNDRYQSIDREWTSPPRRRSVMTN